MVLVAAGEQSAAEQLMYILLTLFGTLADLTSPATNLVPPNSNRNEENSKKFLKLKFFSVETTNSILSLPVHSKTIIKTTDSRKS